MRAKKSVKRDGKKLKVTILKTHVDNREEERTIKRTIDGEKADLQVKWVKHSDGIEIVHIHCMRDKKSNEWGRASGTPVEKSYHLVQKNTTWEITCKKCGRKWNTGGSTGN